MKKELDEKQVGIAPVEKIFQVNLPIERAFRLFTEEIHTWWPLATHSVGGDQAVICVFDTKVGGRIYEIQEDGAEAEWGRVRAWEPPKRVTFTWHPGRDESTAQEVQVTFDAETGGTRVHLIHKDWDLLGDLALKTRQNYDAGWEVVLGRYSQQASALDDSQA